MFISCNYISYQLNQIGGFAIDPREQSLSSYPEEISTTSVYGKDEPKGQSNNQKNVTVADLSFQHPMPGCPLASTLGSIVFLGGAIHSDDSAGFSSAIFSLLAATRCSIFALSFTSLLHSSFSIIDFNDGVTLTSPSSSLSTPYLELNN